VAVSAIWGDLLWVDSAGRAAATSTSPSNWQGLQGVLEEVAVAGLLGRGFGGTAKARQR
jgi:hypothetical protein